MKPPFNESTAPAVVSDGRAQVEGQRVEPVTPESITRAQEAQRAERAEVLDRLGPGWMFTADGRLVRRPVQPWGLGPFNLAESIEAGLTAANFVAAAVYGPRSKRTH